MNYLCCDDSEIKWYIKMRNLSNEIIYQIFTDFYIVSLDLMTERINILIESANLLKV